jgi:ankyrin repeat protein
MIGEKDNHGLLPLHAAAQCNPSVAVVGFVLDAWPEAVRVKDGQGALPLHLAAMNNPSVEVVEYLVKAWPASLQKKNRRGELPLHVAAESNESLDVTYFLSCAWPSAIRVATPRGILPVDDTEIPWNAESVDDEAEHRIEEEPANSVLGLHAAAPPILRTNQGATLTQTPSELAQLVETHHPRRAFHPGMLTKLRQHSQSKRTKRKLDDCYVHLNG